MTTLMLCLLLLSCTTSIWSNLFHSSELSAKAALSCNATGVTHNADGSFTFAQLHVGSQGDVVDNNNCVIHLLGINQGGLNVTDAGGTTNLAREEAIMQFYHNTLHSSIVRVNYQAYWWTSDAYVPNAHLHYRQWLQTFVRLEEQAGNYVMLDTGPQWHDPPCGNDGMGVNITFCHPQKGQPWNLADPTQQVWYQPTALRSITDLASIYAHDPAILFDVWNEPFEPQITQSLYFTDMNERINAVRASAPTMPVIVFFRYLNVVMAGQAPGYPQGNLIIDHHVYGTAQKLQPSVTFSRAHGMGTIINEYGGSQFNPAAVQPLESFATTQDVGLLYFQASNLVTPSKSIPYPLSSNGTMMRDLYQRILSAAGMASPTAGATA
jgi:hypothetical protein